MALTLIPCKRPKFRTTEPRYRKLQGMIQEFINSSDDCVEITWRGQYNNVKSCCNAFHMAIRRLHQYPAVRVHFAGDRIYLAKESKNVSNS